MTENCRSLSDQSEWRSGPELREALNAGALADPRMKEDIDMDADQVSRLSVVITRWECPKHGNVGGGREGQRCGRIECLRELVQVEYVPRAAADRGAVDALRAAHDAMVHRPVDSELFRAAIAQVVEALGGDPDDAGGQYQTPAASDEEGRSDD